MQTRGIQTKTYIVPARATIQVVEGESQFSLHALTEADKKRLIDDFLASEDVKKSSRKTYGQSINQYFAWLQSTGRSLQGLTRTDIICYKDALLKSGHSILTVRSYLVAVRKFYGWAEGMRMYENIAAGVKNPRKNQGGSKERFVKMHLTSEQAARLLEFYKDNPRNYALVNLMLRTGLRCIEASRARICDISSRSGVRVLHVWGKGMDAPDPSVYVVLTDAAYEPIRTYLATRPGALAGEPLFVTEGTGSNVSKDEQGRSVTRPHSGEEMSTRLIQLTIKKGLRAIGLDNHAYSAHSLRHTTGTEMIRNGATVLDVQRTLRHASVNTTMIYISSIQEEEQLRNCAEALLDNSFL